MRVASNLSKSLRTAPVQERSARRVQSFLDAAAALFGELGYEGTTMTAVAERSGSSIGALYNYFPDKPALARALVGQYGAELEAMWRPLIQQATTLTLAEFADQFLERIHEWIEQRPAYLSLVAAPLKFRRDPKVRRSLRLVVVEVFRARTPEMPEDTAWLHANVVLQIVKGMTALLSESAPKEKPAVVEEFKRVLALYLGSIFIA